MWPQKAVWPSRPTSGPGGSAQGSWLPAGIGIQAGTGLALRLLPSSPPGWECGGPGTCGGFWGEQTRSGAGPAGSPCPREVSSGGTGNVCGLSTAEKPGGWNSPDHVVWGCPGPGLLLASPPFCSQHGQVGPASPPSSGVGGLPWASGERGLLLVLLSEFLFCENSRFRSSCKK